MPNLSFRIVARLHASGFENELPKMRMSRGVVLLVDSAAAGMDVRVEECEDKGRNHFKARHVPVPIVQQF